MSVQDYIDILLGLVAFLGTTWLNHVWRKQRELEKALVDLELKMVEHYTRRDDVDKMFESINAKLARLESLELLLAKHYVSKDEFLKSMDALFSKLDKIENKLDKKVDK